MNKNIINIGIHPLRVPKTLYQNSIRKMINNLNRDNVKIKYVQIFISSPRSKRIVMKQAEDFKKFIKLSRLTVIAHSSYTNIPWGGIKVNASLEFTKKELEMCRRCGIQGLVIHIGIVKKYKELEKYLEIINIYAEKQDVIIYIEPTAVLPKNAELAKIIDITKFIKRIDRFENIGLCFDTAHLWASGISDMKIWYNNLMKLNYKRLMFHLNDSERLLGSGKDKHNVITKGNIWKNNNDWKYLIEQFNKNKQIFICEMKKNKEYTEIMDIISK